MAQTIISSYTWGQLFDFLRRKAADAVSMSDPDKLLLARTVSAFLYSKLNWPFTLVTTTLGQIPAVNLLQDYPQPADLYRLSRAWFYVPLALNANNGGNLPPYSDPSQVAYNAAAASAAYVGVVGSSGSVAALTYPLSGSLDVVKRLPVNLLMGSYTSIQAITQQPNAALLRLDAATAVNLNQPYSLELEYQPVLKPLADLSSPLWFPDDYIAMAEEGILYYLYKYNNDQRAGTASFSPGAQVAYSSQYATWMAAIEAAASAERSGSVIAFSPSGSLGSGYGGSYGWFA